MKKLSATIIIVTSIIGQLNAAVVFGGDFQMYKPGTGNTVIATLDGTSYVPGVGSNLQVAAGGSVSYSDSSTPGVPGGDADIDMPGWTTLQGGADLVGNGMGGTTGMNLYAAWGGDSRIVTASAVGTVTMGQSYTITSMVNGDANTPIQGPLAFHLLANGVQIAPSSFLDPVAPYGAFQQISRTYDAATMAAFAGQSLTIVIGVEDANNFENRIIFDDVSLVSAIPEPTVALLGGVGALALLLRRRNS